jgi:pyruvate/2-oxoglutarate dehydrogenase complex dihydrolipoamide dehydrogenase (E3) component
VIAADCPASPARFPGVRRPKETCPMTEDHFEFFIIGGGQAGIPIAHALARAGRRVALAERKFLGGSCVNFGCTPTKAAIASARVAHLARRGSEFGLTIPSVTVDFAAVLARARSIAEASRAGLDRGFDPGRDRTGSGGAVLLRGHARLEGRAGAAFRLAVGGRQVTADRIILNTGTRAFVPPIPGLDQAGFITADNWLAHTDLPEHLILIGGGYIGLEMAQFYRRMGSRVTVIETGSQIAAHEDPEVAASLQAILEGEGVAFRLGAGIARADRSGGQVAMTVGAERLVGSHLFVATGRQPNTDDLGLETVGLQPDAHGIVAADRRLKSKVDGIFVAGDIRGGPMFTHTSWDDYRILESQLIGDGSRTTDRLVPYAMFVDPELGRVGLTEGEARKAGRNIKIGRFDMRHSGKATEIGETAGFIKLVVDADTDRLLGAAVLASEGAELVHIYVDLMNAGAPVGVIRDAIHIHPTLAEAVQSAVASVPG